MKTVIAQVTRDYLCLTCCEPIIKEKENKKEGTADLSYRFTAPFIKMIDRDMLEGKNNLWEIPKAFATMVHDGLREMKRPEVKEVIILVEEFDLVSSEFQHARCNKKTLDNLAVENLKEVLQGEIKDFSVITTTYGMPAKEVPEITSKTFGIPRNLSTELTRRFTEMGLTLLKITPADIPLLKVARDVVYSYNKTVCMISVDYTALRVVIVRDSLPIYCHTFHSPMLEAADIIAQDRQLTIPEAIEYIKNNGLNSEYEYNTPAAIRRIEALREDLIADVVHNVNLVSMSLDLTIEQAVLCDYAGFFPKVPGIVKKIGLCKDVDLITDQFNTKMALPELDIDARDAGLKTGSFILFNNLMNCGDKYKNNLMVGLQPLKEKSINIGKRCTYAFAIVAGVAMVAASGFYAYLHIQKSMDEAKLKEPNYVKAADLLNRQADIKQKLANQQIDAGKLPECPLSMVETMEEAQSQIKEKVKKITGYSMNYSETTDGASITLPIAGTIESFEDFLKMRDDAKENGFFIVKEGFNISQSDNRSDGSSFTLSLTNIVDTEKEKELFTKLKGSSATTVETATEAAK